MRRNHTPDPLVLLRLQILEELEPDLEEIRRLTPEATD